MKCGRCRRKRHLIVLSLRLPGGEDWTVEVCGPCKDSFEETIPAALLQWKRGALYMVDDPVMRSRKLFLATGGTYTGILR